MHFADMLQGDGNWNTSRLSALLDPVVVPYVIGVPPPSLDDTRDMDACDPKWACIWSLPVTQRIRMFLWLVLRQRLLTNGERVRRGLSFDPSCSCCGCYNETILHILRDCPPVRSFWQSIIPQADHECFFGASLEHWIVSNIKATRAFGRDTPPWSLFFSTFIWQTAPPHDWVSLNTDAAVSSSYNFGAISGVLRGLTGDWLCGYCKFVGVVSPLNAELWSILEGLNMAWTMGFPRVQVQSDCSVAIRLILDPMAASSSSGLVRRISALQNRPWSLRFLWVPRETNMVVDGLSKLPSMHDF
ncbi:hypothetical protein V6N11_011006 [Hibiscus sabdariffa]|uniref:Uncharacterized protein n=1 Tax=Hibiscus sabdariffa TaxID=183260 RepID=A0ABR2S6Y2_9ROSI